ncbi:MAG: UxaA family hydrolase [Burkholderiales bacterium]
MRNEATDGRVMVLAPGDNVAVARTDLEAGTQLSVMGRLVTLEAKILTGHKFAFVPVAKGGKLVKYGAPIGVATQDIAAGEYMHIHNVASDYIPTYTFEDGHEYFTEAH